MANILLINGSPHPNGCTATALEEMTKVLHQEGMETHLLHVGNKDIRGCISCNTCEKRGKCVFLSRRTAWWWAAPFIMGRPTAACFPSWIGCFTARPSPST